MSILPLEEIGARAKAASKVLASLSAAEKNKALQSIGQNPGAQCPFYTGRQCRGREGPPAKAVSPALWWTVSPSQRTASSL